MRHFTLLVLCGAALTGQPELLGQELTGLWRLPASGREGATYLATVGYADESRVFEPWAQPHHAAPASYDIAPIDPEPIDPEPMLAPEASFASGFSGPRIYVQGDGLYWHRVGTGCDDILATNVTTGGSLLSAGDLHFNGAGGFRLLLGWQPDACHGCTHCSAWELGYFGIFGLNAEQQVAGPGNLAIPGNLGLASNNFFLADILDYKYRSQLNNVELNCVKSCCQCWGTIDFLCGFRYINLSEDFTITGTDFQEGTSSYNVHTDNNLYGLQLGGRFTSQFASCWSYQLTGKAALFYNDVQQTQAATDFPNFGGAFSLRDPIGDEGSAVAALGELDFVLIRQLNEMWSLRLGYSAIGLGGLALAPDQLDFTDTPTSGSDLSTTGWVFLHGGLAGLEARW